MKLPRYQLGMNESLGLFGYARSGTGDVCMAAEVSELETFFEAQRLLIDSLKLELRNCQVLINDLHDGISMPEHVEERVLAQIESVRRVLGDEKSSI